MRQPLTPEEARELERMRSLLSPASFELSEAVMRADLPRLGSLMRSAGLGPLGGAASAMEEASGAMWRALQYGRPRVVRALLELGYPPNHRRPHADNETAAMMAAYHGCAQGLLILLGAGADPLALDDFGGGALTLACSHGRDECARILLDAGVAPDHGHSSDKPPCALAIQQGHAGCLEALLDAGASPDEAPILPRWAESGSSLMHHATLHGELGCMRLLAARGAAIDARAVDGRTPLMWAASLVDGRAACDLLISWGADPGLVDRDGLGAAAIARGYGREELAAHIEDYSRSVGVAKELSEELARERPPRATRSEGPRI